MLPDRACTFIVRMRRAALKTAYRRLRLGRVGVAPQIEHDGRVDGESLTGAIHLS